MESGRGTSSLSTTLAGEVGAESQLTSRFALGYQNVLLKVVAAVSLVLLWWVGSLLLPANVLPSPWATFQTLLNNAASGLLLQQSVPTMQRIAAGFVLAMGLGVVLGIIMGLSRVGEATLDLWVMVALTIPSLCYVIVIFMVLGMNELSTVIAIGLTAFPSIAINVWQGVKNVDNRLSDMARVFGVSREKRLLQVVLPQVLPYMIAAARFGLGIVWKVTVVAELLGRSDGIGFQLHYWFQLFNMPQVFSWTLFFTLIMLFLELVVLKSIEDRAFRWRPAARL
jgi:NitT/TauT family transport system permease protein